VLLLKPSPLWGACWSSSHLPGAPWGPDWTTGLPLPRLHCTTSWPSEALTALGMLYRTEPSTVVILLASVFPQFAPSTPPPPFSTRRPSRRSCQDISFPIFLSSCLCCVSCRHSPVLSTIAYRRPRTASTELSPLRTGVQFLSLNDATLSSRLECCRNY